MTVFSVGIQVDIGLHLQIPAIPTQVKASVSLLNSSSGEQFWDPVVSSAFKPVLQGSRLLKPPVRSYFDSLGQRDFSMDGLYVRPLLFLLLFGPSTI